VDVGVIGFMTIWGINLDTISMITIIMSIGFSVDFAAHIAHAFVLSSDKDAGAKEKVKAAMAEIAWPILQGATSTILGVVVLADLDSYMVVAFFKTVFLVIVLALIHGLVFLPVLLGVFVTRRCGAGKVKKHDSNVNLRENGDIPMAFSNIPQRQDSAPVTVRSRHSSRVHPVSDHTPAAFSQSTASSSQPSIAYTGIGMNFESAVTVETDARWINGGSNPAFEMDDVARRLTYANSTIRESYADSRM